MSELEKEPKWRFHRTILRGHSGSCDPKLTPTLRTLGWLAIRIRSCSPAMIRKAVSVSSTCLFRSAADLLLIATISKRPLS